MVNRVDIVTGIFILLFMSACFFILMYAPKSDKEPLSAGEYIDFEQDMIIKYREHNYTEHELYEYCLDFMGNHSTHRIYNDKVSCHKKVNEVTGGES